MIISFAELLEGIKNENLSEIRAQNIELKRTWEQGVGKKISAFSNRINEHSHFICIGLSDDGRLCGHPESWAKSTEEIISQHINKFLDPHIACLGIIPHELSGQWVIIVECHNPGCVVYWNNSAYKGSGTTIEQMTPEESMQLTISLPGLSDFTSQMWSGTYNQDMASEYASTVSKNRIGTSWEYISILTPDDALQRIGIYETHAQRILFGELRYRFVLYDRNEIPVFNRDQHGLYGIIKPSFSTEIQNLSKEYYCLESDPYPVKALREGLANAVAHAAYFEGDGELMIELYPHKVCISNLCLRESEYFANKWFSRNRNTVNKVLMETLRLAGYVDELGRGKNLIFSESLRNGKRPPEVVLEKGGRYNRWRLNIYGVPQHNSQLRVFERLKEMYRDEQKVMIANGLVLWRDQPASYIRKCVDGESKSIVSEIIADRNGPVFYSEKDDRFLLRRWAGVLLGEGKDSKCLSAAEELNLLNHVRKMQIENERGFLTPKQLRAYAGMGETISEKTLTSRILKKWIGTGELQRVKKGLYRFQII